MRARGRYDRDVVIVRDPHDRAIRRGDRDHCHRPPPPGGIDLNFGAPPDERFVGPPLEG
jgi:hypothetical protein